MENITQNSTGKSPSKNRRTMQRRAADMMMAGDSAEVIAKKLGIRLDTIMRWQKAKAFQDRMRLHKTLLHEEICLDLMRAVREASRHVVENPAGKLESTMDRMVHIIKCAQTVIK